MFTAVVGVTKVGVATLPVLTPKLLEVLDVDEGSEAGTTPVVPVTPSQRPWQSDVVDPEPVLPGCRPCPVGVLSAFTLVVVPVVVVPVVVVPVVVVSVVVVSVVVVGVVVVVVSVGVVSVVVGVVVVVVSVGVVSVVVDVVVVAGAVEVVVVVVVAASASVVATGVVASWALTLGLIASTSCSGERCASARPASLFASRSART
ncbi:MAG TPA: hypothetical protein VMJ65_03855 [Solirubrobacteraceae bacterium]|nr:hypothetical protein [Solirubrobacteraceae bacterium]